MRRLLINVAAVVLVAGCAQSVWVRPGATASDFTRDRAVCDYQSELGTPNTYNGRGNMSDAIASGISDGIRKGMLMNKCMVANGWTLQRVEPSPNHGDSAVRVVVGPPGNQSVLDGTGRYIGPAPAPPLPTGNRYDPPGETEWSRGYTYRTQTIGARCGAPPGNSKNPADWTIGCLAGEKASGS